MDRGKRTSSYGAFLAGKSRPNLFIATHALVEKILFDDSKRAYAVKYKQNGHHKIVMARKEIILSAGAIGSPQILMLSGVGPKDHLKSLEVTFVFLECFINKLARFGVRLTSWRTRKWVSICKTTWSSNSGR